MNVIFDATLPPRVARSLHVLVEPAHTISHVRDALGKDATDPQLAAYLQKQIDAAVISVDLDISDHPHRIAALREWGKPVFLLSTGWLELNTQDFSWLLVRQIPAILHKAQTISGPAVFVVTPGLKGRIRKVA